MARERTRRALEGSTLQMRLKEPPLTARLRQIGRHRNGHFHRYSIAAVVVLLSGCVSSKLTRLPVIATPSAPVETVALNPSGGIMAEAIGVELFAYGFGILDTESTSRLIGQSGLVDFLILQESAVSAVLDIVWYPGYDGRPNAVVAKIVDTLTGNLIAGVSWQNGRAGAQGSPADNIARKGMNEAAAEIAGALAAQLR